MFNEERTQQEHYGARTVKKLFSYLFSKLNIAWYNIYVAISWFIWNHHSIVCKLFEIENGYNWHIWNKSLTFIFGFDIMSYIVSWFQMKHTSHLLLFEIALDYVLDFKSTHVSTLNIWNKSCITCPWYEINEVTSRNFICYQSIPSELSDFI